MAIVRFHSEEGLARSMMSRRASARSRWIASGTAPARDRPDQRLTASSAKELLWDGAGVEQEEQELAASGVD